MFISSSAIGATAWPLERQHLARMLIMILSMGVLAFRRTRTEHPIEGTFARI